MMGALADQGLYDEQGIQIGTRPDPRASLPLWAAQADAYPQSFEPAVGMWPTPRPPREEEKPNPLIPFSAWRADPPKRTAGTIAADIESKLIPTSPLDIGLTIATGGASLPVRMGALAAGATLDPDDAEAASIRKVLSATSPFALERPSPIDFHRIANAKLRRPLADIPFEATGAPPTSQLVTPSWLEGAVLTPLVGDPTVRGLTIKSIDDIPLTTPMQTQGGHGYIRDTEGYANAGGLATTIANRVKGLQQDFNTDRIIGAYTKMGPQSGDFAHHNWGAVSRMLPNAEIATKDVEKLDELIRKEIANVPRTEAMIKNNRQWDFPHFPGVLSPGLEQHLAENADPYRKAFLYALEKARVPGAPDVVAARYAVTDPALLNAPTGASGLSMTQLTGDVVAGAHPDFPRHLTGKGNWTLGGSVPQEVMYPDIIERFDKAQPPDRWARKMYMAPDKGKMHGQLATPRWVDDTSRYMEDAQQMGDLAAFDKYLRSRFGWGD